MRRVTMVAKNSIFPGHKVHDQTFALAILWHMSNAIGPPGLPVTVCARQIQGGTIDFHRTCGGLIATQNFQQFRLPIARHPGDAQNFSGTQREAHILQPRDPGIIHYIQAGDLQHLMFGLRWRFIHPQQNLPPNHQFRQIFRACL